MFNNNKILAVIPAENFSKEIPRKNVRLLGKKPLIGHIIETLKSSKYIDDIVISTNDAEISRIGNVYDVNSFGRPEEISGPDVPIEAVIFDALNKKEKQTFDEYDLVISMTPSSPLLKVETLDKAIEAFEDFDVDSVISVREEKSLNWGFNPENNNYYPLYNQRLSKRQLPPYYRETGSFVITRRGFMSESSIIGQNINLAKLSFEESLNINTYEDWWIADKHINKKKIVIVANAFNEIGDVHIKRGISIASKLVFHDVTFVLNKNHELGVNIVKNHNYKHVFYEDADEILDTIDSLNPDIVINDILDTRLEYILSLKEKGYFVINFEDLGPGSEVADLVFDSLDTNQENQENMYSGKEYYISKDEFYMTNTKVISEDVNRVLICIEGMDGNRLTEKILNALISSGFSKHIEVLLGTGFSNKQEFIDKYTIYSNVLIHTDIKSISDLMYKSDIIFSSSGRRLFEIASVGVPCICLAQNDKELSNSFANHLNGFINLGLGSEVSEEQIMDEFILMGNDFELRQAINKRMKAIDLKNGFENFWTVVNKYYRTAESNEYMYN